MGISEALCIADGNKLHQFCGGNCTSWLYSAPCECSRYHLLKARFKPAAPSPNATCIKLMQPICKDLLYTLKTGKINLFNKLLGFPGDADWGKIIEMCTAVSNLVGTNRKCQEDSFVPWKHFCAMFGVKRLPQGQTAWNPTILRGVQDIPVFTLKEGLLSLMHMGFRSKLINGYSSCWKCLGL